MFRHPTLHPFYWIFQITEFSAISTEFSNLHFCRWDCILYFDTIFPWNMDFLYFPLIIYDDNYIGGRSTVNTDEVWRKSNFWFHHFFHFLKVIRSFWSFLEPVPRGSYMFLKIFFIIVVQIWSKIYRSQKISLTTDILPGDSLSWEQSPILERTLSFSSLIDSSLTFNEFPVGLGLDKIQNRIFEFPVTVEFIESPVVFINPGNIR